jgi:hypothetical protein
MRVSEGNGEGAIRGRIARVDQTLTKAERQLETAQTMAARGDQTGARFLKRRAHDDARMAMRLIGILTIEYNLDMGGPISRARRIVAAIYGNARNGSVSPALPGKNTLVGR